MHCMNIAGVYDHGRDTFEEGGAAREAVLRRRVLIVEPYDEIRSLLKAVLVTAETEVVAVSDGRRALEEIAGGDYGCVLIGSPVPVESAGRSRLLIEVIAEKYPHSGESLVLITTHVEDMQILSLAARLKVFSVLAKPFSTIAVREVVSECLSGGRSAERWPGISEIAINEAHSLERS
jgi:DNA-binding NtrC family response regulator